MIVLFWNATEGRLRALFRIIIFVVVAGLLAAVFIMPLESLGEFVEKSLANFMGMLGILLAIYLCGRFIDKRKWTDFGITLFPLRQFFLGALLGALIVSGIFGIQYALGWLELEAIHFNSFMAYPFLLVFAGQVLRYFCGSVFEEAFTRGYLLKNIAEGFHGRLTPNQAVLLSYLITSSIFGILHLANDNASFLSTLNLILIGLLFGWVVIKTGKLHFAIGVHMFWNIFQNNVFGAQNSGKESVVSILTFKNSGNTLWTGGDFGIEGGLLCTIAVVVCLLFFMRRELLGISRFEQRVLVKNN